jgi:hypothetical protein
MTIEAMKQALEALEQHGTPLINHEDAYSASLTALRQAIEAAEKQEPVAWQERQARRMKDGVVTEWTNWYPCRYRTIDEARAEACDHIPYEWRSLYTHPPKREWVGLTDEEIDVEALKDDHAAYFAVGAIWANKRLREKNNM